jgi:ElaB/YqjD/DUF883 family membrane-anchored ribosome-binding protein
MRAASLRCRHRAAIPSPNRRSRRAGGVSSHRRAGRHSRRAATLAGTAIIESAAALVARRTRRSRREHPMTDRTPDNILDEFSGMLGEAEDMLKRAASETGDKARDLRSQVETKLLHAKLRLQELQGQTMDQAKEAARATDDFVHDYPWQSIGIAAALGFVAGLLLNRR